MQCSPYTVAIRRLISFSDTLQLSKTSDYKTLFNIWGVHYVTQLSSIQCIGALKNFHIHNSVRVTFVSRDGCLLCICVAENGTEQLMCRVGWLTFICHIKYKNEGKEDWGIHCGCYYYRIFGLQYFFLQKLSLDQNLVNLNKRV